MSSKFPKSGTPELDQVKQWVASGDTNQQIATKLGVAYQTVKNTLHQLGIRRPQMDEKAPELVDPPDKRFPDKDEPFVVNMPEVILREYTPLRAGAQDPETQVLLLGDIHGGEITPTYNPDVMIKRFGDLFNSTMRITQLHRNMYPVNEIVIPMIGDMIHGENPYQGAKVGSINCGAQEQIFDYVLPQLLSFVLSLKQEFETVRVEAVPGNHGRYSREAPDKSNWDMILYKALKPALEQQGVEMNITNNFCSIFKVKGFKFFAFHGNQVKATQGIPYFALDRKVKSWYITFDGFDYAICGHFHKDDFLRISSKTKLFINGSWVSDDPFALEVIGTSSIPAQWTFGVHEKRGITWAYSLDLQGAK